MKTSILFLANLLFASIFANTSFAADIYAEYKMTGINATPVISKMFSKNGNLRTEMTMNMGGQQITNTTLLLKTNPNVLMAFNSITKTYTETKIATNTTAKNIAIKVLGNEKVGIYKCTRVRMTSEGKSWDIWYTKELPSFNFPVSGNSELSSQKLINELKNKGISGMLAKVVFQIPGSKSQSVTMQLVKYESKTLAPSLFGIPAGYKKNNVSFDAEKMKTMTPQQRKEMIMKMMKEQMKQ